jgi:hypothetical protein
MIYEMVPAKELTGGPWYTEQEFDSEFVAALCDFIVKFVGYSNIVNVSKIHEKVKVSGIAKVSCGNLGVVAYLLIILPYISWLMLP